jgi:hypothetical protein
MATTPNTDRIQLVTPHVGRNVLPNCPLFTKLLRFARRNHLAIRDNILQVERSYGDLLADVLAYRAYLESSLNKDVLQRIERNEEVYVGILAAGGYEFTVGILAVIALGAAVVPMSMMISLSMKTNRYLPKQQQFRIPLRRAHISYRKRGKWPLCTRLLRASLPTQSRDMSMTAAVMSNASISCLTCPRSPT